jgi:hypothetical protein
VLAHAGAADESLSVAILFGALWVGWVGWSRLKGRAFSTLPSWAGPAMLLVAALLVISAAVVPRTLFPATPSSSMASPAAGDRPSSTATLSFRRPVDGSTMAGDELEVVLDLRGGRIVDGASAGLTPDTGHVHLALDGRLVSMTYGVVQVVDLSGVARGPHTLQAEYVAADHAPFDPRVTTSVRFETMTP